MQSPWAEPQPLPRTGTTVQLAGNASGTGIRSAVLPSWPDGRWSGASIPSLETETLQEPEQEHGLRPGKNKPGPTNTTWSVYGAETCWRHTTRSKSRMLRTLRASAHHIPGRIRQMQPSGDRHICRHWRALPQDLFFGLLYIKLVHRNRSASPKHIHESETGSAANDIPAGDGDRFPPVARWLH